MDGEDMNAIEVLYAARDDGVHLRVDGPDIDLSARHEPPRDLLTSIKANKGELVAILTQYPDAETVIEVFDERAAILEYDAGYSRDEAERLAYIDLCQSHDDTWPT